MSFCRQTFNLNHSYLGSSEPSHILFTFIYYSVTKLSNLIKSLLIYFIKINKVTQTLDITPYSSKKKFKPLNFSYNVKQISSETFSLCFNKIISKNLLLGR